MQHSKVSDCWTPIL
nr:unnamed protein product [Callosobruchus chinensis]